MPPASRIASFRAELRDDSPFVATPSPRLSWTVDTAEPDWMQAAAEADDGTGIIALTGEDSALVAWPFTPLAAGERREVRVRAQAASGTWTTWSEPLVVAAGFLTPGEWVAQPVGLAEPDRDAQPTVVRTRFRLGRPVSRALLFWTALGVAEPEVNGTPVSEDVLSPGWTAYRDRLVHETVDVTALVQEGENVLSATLAGAWYTEKYGFFAFADRLYGTQPSFLAQLRVTFDDGTTTTVAATGDGWEAAADGPVVDSGIYAGEHQDLRREITGFSPVRVGAAAKPGYEDVPAPEARIAPPVRRIETLPVVETLAAPSGGTILDLGQNLVGRLRVRVRGAAGTRVTIRHAEVLEDGELALRPLRNAAATATFELSGGEDVLESRFTFYGFRYAQITGAEVDPADVEAVVLHTDMTRTGWFAASDPLIDRLHENVVWGMRGNFLSIPTDCPQRDERLGWTGDLQVFAPTASFLYDSAGFLTSWLRDLAHEQARNDGSVPVVVPSALGGFTGGGASPAAWGDAATVVPTVMHERFGDRDILAAQYESMRAWVDAVGRDAGEGGLWAGRMQLGDWLDPSAPPDKPGQAKVDSDIVASAYYARSLRQVAEAARLLGLETDAAHYGTLAERSRRAFVDEYVTPAGRMMSDAPTAYALALEFDLVTDPAVRAALADRLAALVREGGYRIGTGFVGTPLVADALTQGGHLDAAERLLTQTECPSWLYPVTQEATTVWERWDSLLPDGSVNPGEMTSFNHYALGAVADWLHRTVAGLAPAAPGYRRLRIAPQPLESLSSASARHLTPYGEASVAWRRDGHEIVVTAVVPANTRAEVAIPGAPDEVGSGSHEWRFPAPATPARPPLDGLHASLADVIDDPRAYAALIDTIAAVDPDRAQAIRSETRWGAGRPVTTALMFTPPDLLASVDDAIRRATASA
ncbi:family 78 glycoside hydrolase catalytic domain [Microbacterium sp. KSW4-11]|uniref:alpha-L-rhamnosidase n=1 Tax=Microbacterium gawkjiense TaxID=3067309 RepID=A0ABU3G9W9_9MICO|nr:family 78 glycoside hydrolase catalytic domain [Microbacterium sp. KSW4-11]MDT3316615.1 family 78 glycoside hydrolase catalytic domain [Microbacterium sp. KSW4-11]